MSMKVCCTNNFSKLGFKESLLSGIEPTIQEPSKSMESMDGTFVGWNGFKVAQAEDPALFTTELGPCMALFGKVKDESTGHTYLGLTHFYSKENSLQAFNQMLKELIGKTQNTVVEVFIAGGWKSSFSNRAALNQIIADYNLSQERVKIVADLFGRGELSFYGLDENRGLGYSGSVGIREAGFDQDLNPYVIYGARLEGYEGNYEGLSIIED